MSQTEVQLIKDAVIVNADISNSAAIDVSKISGAMPLTGGTFTNDVTFDGATAGRDILFDRSNNFLQFKDNAKISLGTDDDANLYYDGFNPILYAGTNTLRIVADNIHLEAGDFGDEFLRCNHDGAVELYNDNSKKFQTTSTGVDILGSDTTGSNLNGDLIINNAAGTRYAVFDASDTKLNFSDNASITIGTSNDLKIYHDGSNSYVQDSGTGNLIIAGSAVNILNAAASESMIRATENGAVELYHDNSKKFETTSDGTTTTGVLKVNDATSATSGNRIAVGTSQDIKIYHIGGNDSYIRNATGDFYLQGNNSGTIVNNIKFENSNGATELYFNGAKKLDTTSTGVGLHGLSLATQNHVLYYNSSSGQVSYEAIAGGGKVLQVLQTTSNLSSTGSGSFQDVGLSQAITMTNSANKVLVIASGGMNNAGAGNGGGATIFRGSTNLAHSNDIMAGYFGEDNSNNIEYNATFHKLDTPGSGTHTYAVKIRAFSGTQRFAYRNTGVLTVIELDFS